ncbi:2-dehydro-3-deoxy-6-phosphogalactonate aldolase [Erythrobacter tepidarius]|uniref:2-dehydro-3-deoxy-6-phosphogalactonate aldolase n=1 Tax=Erythrobacter tepidarius TaxID=60454 RepID=UPI000A39EB47|nr:2-dehydro-3-deoxy-6-phosphogalactonate aldolase [Erythrobacter tepidarius]
MTHTIEGRLPLAAILRGLEPERAVAVGEALVEAGFDIIEVPLNSPDPLASIAVLVEALGTRALVGAGTVLAEAEVDALAAIGAGLVVSPNCNPAVIRRSVGHGMVSLPGCFTPTEMFAAIEAGASGLKLFPAEAASPAVIRAVRAVLPPQVPLLAVGGIAPDNMGDFLAAGADGFGIGGALFRPSKPLAEIATDARAIVAAFKAARAG